MSDIIHARSGSITEATDVNLNSGFYYVFSVTGTFDSVQLDAVFGEDEGQRLIILNKEEIIAPGTYTFFSPTSKVRISPTGTGVYVFYHIRMAISPTVTGGLVAMTW